jgi:hypothetical protein
VSPDHDRPLGQVVVPGQVVRDPPQEQRVNSAFHGMTWDEIRDWKRDQEEKGLYP